MILLKYNFDFRFYTASKYPGYFTAGEVRGADTKKTDDKNLLCSLEIWWGTPLNIY